MFIWEITKLIIPGGIGAVFFADKAIERGMSTALVGCAGAVGLTIGIVTVCLVQVVYTEISSFLNRGSGPPGPPAGQH